MATMIDESLLEKSPQWRQLKADALRAAAAATDSERKRLAGERRKLLAEAEREAAKTGKLVSERQAAFEAAKAAFDTAWAALCTAKQHNASLDGLVRQREAVERQLTELQHPDVTAFIERMDRLFDHLANVGRVNTGNLLATYRGGIPREEPEMDPAPINEALDMIRAAKQAARALTLDPPQDLPAALAAIMPKFSRAVQAVL